MWEKIGIDETAWAREEDGRGSFLEFLAQRLIKNLKSKNIPGWDLSLSLSKPDAHETFKELDEQARNMKRTQGRQTVFQFSVHGPECAGRI